MKVAGSSPVLGAILKKEKEEMNDVFDKRIHQDEFKLRLLLTNACNKNCVFCLNDFQDKPSDEKAVQEGLITEDEIVEQFRAKLKEGLKK